MSQNPGPKLILCAPPAAQVPWPDGCVAAWTGSTEYFNQDGSPQSQKLFLLTDEAVLLARSYPGHYKYFKTMNPFRWFTVVFTAIFSRLARDRSARTLRNVISITVGVLWLAPMSALLVLNLKQHIIGASVWCPFNSCQLQNPLRYDYVKAAKFDELDHDALGALQFVGKALEIWFGFIAGSLVYCVAKMLSAHKNGMPVGLMFAHHTYSDPLTFFDKVHWTSAKTIGPQPSKKHGERLRLYFFILFTVFMCLIFNLMGPAASVLSLPTLQWIDSPKYGIQFGQFQLSTPPSGQLLMNGGLFRGCSNESLRAGNYSCTGGAYLADWEDMTASTVNVQQQNGDGDYFLQLVNFLIVPETGLNFAFNTSDYFSYTPSRQTLRELAYDQAELQSSRDGKVFDNGLDTYNISLNTKLVRQGPVVTTHMMNFTAEVHAVNISGSPNKQIRCYEVGAEYAVQENYWQCIRTGIEWSPHNIQTNFSIEAENTFSDLNYTDANLIHFSSFFVDKTALFYVTEGSTNGTRNGLPSCMYKNAKFSTCDWEKDFSSNEDSTISNQLYLEIDTVVHAKRFVASYRIYTSFALYELDVRDPLGIVQTSILEDYLELGENGVVNYVQNDTLASIVHPDWILATWSVNRYGVISKMASSGFWLSYHVIHHLEDKLHNRTGPLATYNAKVTRLLTDFTVLQAMSMVPWTNMTDVMRPSQVAGFKDSKEHPVLKRYGTFHVWAYGLSGRTAKLGAIVAIIGMLLTAIRTAFCLILGSRKHSSLDIFTVAIRRPYAGEFDGVFTDDIGKVRYQHLADENGELVLRSTSHYERLESDSNVTELTFIQHKGKDENTHYN